MIQLLNEVRAFLLELSPELGVTDPVSGAVVTHRVIDNGMSADPSSFPLQQANDQIAGPECR